MEHSNKVSAEALAAARVMLSQLGITAADLTAPAVAVPTFAEVIPQVRKTLTPGTLRTYNTHFRHLLDRWATRRLDEPTPAELDAFAHEIVARAALNQAPRGGRGAGENFVAATRCVYRFAEGRWISAAVNPARNWKKPARRPTRRFAIPAQQLAEICQVVATTGTDPDLDSLILRLVTETACRRAGALALRPRDLDPDQCLVFLREKSDSDRWQPVSPTLIQYLLDHAAEREAARHRASCCVTETAGRSPPDGSIISGDA